MNGKLARRHPSKWVPDVRLCFQLPKTLAAFVAPGKHGFGVFVHRGGFVQVTHGSSEQCFTLAQEFLASVARQRPGFTMMASIICGDRWFARHLTVVAGALVVSSHRVNPLLIEGRAA